MAQMFGGKSEYLVKKERHNFFIAGIALVLIFSIIFFYWIINKNISFNLNTTMFLAVVFIFLFFILKLIFENHLSTFDKFNRGKIGEDKICGELRKLPEGFLAFQDVNIPYRGGNIDFVVVGPMGLLVIEVKSHGGKIEFNGKKLLRNGRIFKEKKNFLKQAMSEAMNLHDYLKQKTGREFFVTPVLVFSNKWASMKFGFQPIDNVYVVGKPLLNQLIAGNNNNLSQVDIELLKDELLQLA